MPSSFGYWNVRGAGQPIRSLLEFTGEEYEDQFYPHSLWRPGKTREFYLNSEENKEGLPDWHSLGLDFPNLPYYIDGDVKITGTLVIARYIARKHDLVGRTEAEKLQVDLLQHTAYDIYWFQFLPMVFRNMTNKAGLKQEFEAFVDGPLPGHFENFSKFLGDKKFFIGDNVTYVDFYLYELFFNFSFIAPDLIKKYSNIQNFQQRIEALPAIAKYMKTEKYMKYLQKPLTAKFVE